MDFMQGNKFLNICKVYICVDQAINMPNEMKIRMDALVIYYNKPMYFDLYYDKLNQFLNEMVKLHKLKCPICPNVVDI